VEEVFTELFASEAAVVAELAVPVEVTVFVKLLGLTEPVGVVELVSAPAVLVVGPVEPVETAELVPAVWAASVELLFVVLAEPADVAGSISVELLGFVTAPGALLAGKPAVTVAFVAGLVDAGRGALGRLAALVELGTGSVELADELVSTLAA
jgi:hypothetical protein